MTDTEWRKLARDARQRGKECPDTETLRRFTEAEPGAPTVAAHVASCARCAHEAGEIRSFFDPAHPGSAATLATVRAALERTLSPAVSEFQRRATVRSIAPARRGPSLYRWSAGLAATILLTSAVAVHLSDRMTPPSPARPAPRNGGVMRGETSARLLSPRGSAPDVPTRFAWEPVGPQPAGWDFQLERVDGTVLWTARTEQVFLDLPEEVRTELKPGTRYLWRVRPAGALATGTAVAFDISP